MSPQDRVYLTPSGAALLRDGEQRCIACREWKPRSHFLPPHDFPGYKRAFQNFCDVCLERRYLETECRLRAKGLIP